MAQKWEYSEVKFEIYIECTNSMWLLFWQHHLKPHCTTCSYLLPLSRKQCLIGDHWSPMILFFLFLLRAELWDNHLSSDLAGWSNPFYKLVQMSFKTYISFFLLHIKFHVDDINSFRARLGWEGEITFCLTLPHRWIYSLRPPSGCLVKQ